jgi:hypothetical protein
LFDLGFLSNGESTYLSERFEKRRTRIDFIIDPIEGAYFLNNAEIHKILQFPLHGLKRKTDFVHDLSLVKRLAGPADEEGQNSCPGDRPK